MTVSEDFIISNLKKHPIAQMINKSKDVVVTIRKKNGLVFVTNYFQNKLPLSCYLNLDDIQSKLTEDEIEKCFRKAIEEGGWSFKFHKTDI